MGSGAVTDRERERARRRGGGAGDDVGETNSCFGGGGLRRCSTTVPTETNGGHPHTCFDKRIDQLVTR